MSTDTKGVAEHRIVLTLAGSHDEERARKGTEESLAAFRSRQPVFDLVVDVTELETGTSAAMESLATSERYSRRSTWVASSACSARDAPRRRRIDGGE